MAGMKGAMRLLEGTRRLTMLGGLVLLVAAPSCTVGDARSAGDGSGGPARDGTGFGVGHVCGAPAECASGACCGKVCVNSGGELGSSCSGGSTCDGAGNCNAPLFCDQVGTDAFVGCYYSDMNLGTLKLARTDTTINFDWGTGSPDPIIGNDSFSVRWQGNFIFEAADHIFTATADDGVRLYVDGALIIDQWKDQGATVYTARRSMTAGAHLVKMEYYDNVGHALAKLSWATVRTYSTNFDLTENPISEGGNWIMHGKTVGIDWADVKTSNGNATGTAESNFNSDWNDAIALLAGEWGADQTAEGVIHLANQTDGGASGFGSYGGVDCNKEVELYLRGNVTANHVALYTITFSSGWPYYEVGHWDGPRGYGGMPDPAGGGYYSLLHKEGPYYKMYDGDKVAATISGNTISVYRNGALLDAINVLVDVNSASVPPITSGHPGIGFYSGAGCAGAAHNDDFGFSSFTATDGP